MGANVKKELESAHRIARTWHLVFIPGKTKERLQQELRLIAA